MEELEALWRAWSEQDRPIRQALMWAVVKATIVEQQVASPVTSDQWEILEASLTLLECDSGAQRSLFRTFEFDSCGSKQFGPGSDGSGSV